LFIRKWKQIAALALTLGLLSPFTPVVSAPVKTTLTQALSAKPAPAQTFYLYQATLGMSTADVLKKLGQPNRKDPSHIGVEWWIYNKDLQNYLQIGIQNNKVVSIFSNGSRLNVHGITYGTPVATLAKLWGRPQQSLAVTPHLKIMKNTVEQHPSYLRNNHVYTFSIDKLGGNKVVGVRISTREHFASIALGLLYPISYSKLPAPLPRLSPQQQQAVALAYEKQNFDMTNIARIRAKLPPLKWNSKAAAVARAHSMDMASHRFFSHTSPRTGSPFDRLQKAGIPMLAAGENIASRQLDGIEVHIAWMNSAGHRQNILHPAFKELGVGTVLQSQKDIVYTYYTQNFITQY